MIDRDNMVSYETLLNRIYHNQLESVFILIPKKYNAKKSSDYHLISIAIPTLKIFFKITHNTIYKKCEDSMGDTQFGFRTGLGTLFSVQELFSTAGSAEERTFLLCRL